MKPVDSDAASASRAGPTCKLAVACGNSSRAKTWTNKKMTFEQLKARLRNTLRTSETVDEYKNMKSTDRETAKDHGGFVAGELKNGRRRIDAVLSRSMITLDGDQVTQEFVDEFEKRVDFAAVLYSTHSYTKDVPRVRVVMPLSRDVTAEEFIAVSRYVAADFGIDQFDECSYRPNQLMYWPSTPSDGIYIYKEVDRPWLDPDRVLAAHPEWKDPTMLPTSSRESITSAKKMKKVQDPLQKKGVIGAFCRAYYPIGSVVEAYLSDVYEPSDDGTRYRYIPAESVPGVEVVGEGKFLYSHHASDPASMKLCNAFDIVRIHRFGHLEPEKSLAEMSELAAKDELVKAQILAEKQSEAEADFGSPEDAGPSSGGGGSSKPPNSSGNGPPSGKKPKSWKSKLRFNAKTGKLENILQNILLILQNDPKLQGIVFNQLADGMEIKAPVPWSHPSRFWRDADDAQLISYIDSHYGSFSQRNYEVAITKVADDRSYHPIREMFESLPKWDGVPRVETLLIDYLGAEDNAYVRAVTRKMLCAAYYRVYHPGAKFDYMLVLNGPQGIGKSTLISKLGMDWFCDSLAISDMNDKTAAEKLQGFWIHEIGEMAGMKKADIEKVKAFVSRSDDKYRASFGRRVTPHPRQCVFFGTTNSENGYLRDVTGNRRFWNVKVNGEGLFQAWDLDTETVRQLWAEAKVLADAGEELFLSYELEKHARAEQKEAMESDDREGLVEAYLNTLIPADWYDWDFYKRRNYFVNEDDPTRPPGVMPRTHISNIEIWCECFGRFKADIRPADSYSISTIMEKICGWERTGRTVQDKVYGKQRVYQKI